jgi:P-type Cu+ transporter
MGRSKFFLKDSGVIEKMSRLTSIVFDKTGTITQSGASQPIFVGTTLTSDQKSLIYSVVRQSTHPLSILIAELFNTSEIRSIKNFEEREGAGLSADINGYHIKIGSHDWVDAKSEDRVDQTAVFVSIDNELIGYFRIANLFRKGLTEIIPALKSRYSLALLSGDNDSERERLSGIFGRDTGLHFNQSPQDKLNYIVSETNLGKKVAMIGDGLNDAGALKTATIGITVAESDSNFSPACDGILMAPAFKRLPNFFKLAGDSMNIIKISFAISFLYNFAGLFFAVQGLLSPVIAAILMPASSVTVVVFTTLATSLTARNRGVF